MPERIIVYYDYLCPFCWRGAELAELVAEPLGITFDWRHFSLYQSNHDRARGNGGWQLWNDPLLAGEGDGGKGLLPFLASCASRLQGDDLHHDFRLELLRARHRDRRPLDLATVREVARAVGLHLPRFESDLSNPECRTVLAQEHHRAERCDVFGTPTFAFGNGHTAYVRLREIPERPSEAVELFQHLRGTLERYPHLETLKRPRPRIN